MAGPTPECEFDFFTDTCLWKRTRALAAATVAAVLVAVPSVRADTLFWEDFDGYTYFPTQNPANDWINAGIPELLEGADEFWYGGRLLFFIEAGFTDVTLSFDWRTFSTNTADRFVAGYHVGDDLGFDQGANRFRDFFTDDFGGNHAAAEQWWNDEWVELVRDRSGTFQSVNVALPDDQDIWVAFWLDNGESDFGKVDNVHVQGTPVPEPATALLLVGGLMALAAARRR